MQKQQVVSSQSEHSLSPERIFHPKKEEDRHARPLDYLPPKQELDRVKKQLNDEPRTPLSSAKIEQQNKLMCGRNVTRAKAKVETVMFAPPAREIPLIAKKMGAQEAVNPRLEFEVAARKLVEGMKRAHKLDRKAVEAGSLAYHKVKMVEHLKDKLTNIYVRRSFVQQGGVGLVEKWLERSVGRDQVEREPSLHLRINCVRVLQTLDLTADDLQNTKHLQHLLHRNRMSQVQQLRELCREVLAAWDYTLVEHAARKR